MEEGHVASSAPERGEPVRRDRDATDDPRPTAAPGSGHGAGVRAVFRRPVAGRADRDRGGGPRPRPGPARPAVDGRPGPRAVAAGPGGLPARGGRDPRPLAAYGLRPGRPAGWRPARPFRSWADERPALAGAMGESHTAGARHG